MSDRQAADAELLATMTATAVEAGRVVFGIYRGEFDVALKTDDSPVTIADHAAEAVILKRLRAVAPGVPIIAEEECAAGRIPSIGTEFFLVDPLDGTKEFVHRRGEFTVNIALIRAGVPQLGVVYAPASASLFIGDVSARRAFRADQRPGDAFSAPSQPIAVRAVPTEGLTVVCSRSHSNPQTEAYLRGYPIAKRVSVGSSLKFCLLAAAQADLYPRLGATMEWDTAAGHAVLTAAGGEVWAPGGVPLRYGKAGFRNDCFVACGTLVPRPLAAAPGAAGA
ncbi:MAG TPA: 3'(2'),5'-bisphosphate nucleotidase CysQ [Steroidobacteraceae bacterium]